MTERRTFKQNQAMIERVMAEEEARLLEVELDYYDKVLADFPESLGWR